MRQLMRVLHELQDIVKLCKRHIQPVHMLLVLSRILRFGVIGMSIQDDWGLVQDKLTCCKWTATC